VAHDGVIAGEAVREGDAILVMLAAATRDPAVAADPDRFDPAGIKRVLDFGAGVHACPADTVAPLIAEIAVAYLLDAGLDLEHLKSPVSYRRSAHVRMPLF
jgi:cytochrome P450